MSKITFNSNITSLNVQRNLTLASQKVSESYARLSSGSRITAAKDDAAGLAISETLKSNARISQQGVRNINDGVSLLAIAESAVSTLKEVVVRLEELATQSSNGTLSARQREALEKEAKALSEEYNRVARSTQFNGRALFNADFGPLQLAAGSGAGSTLHISMGGGISDGTYSAALTYASGIAPNDVKAVDVNGDGISDLIVAETTTDSIGVFIGRGDGTFGTRVSYIAGDSPREVVIGDYNGDGNVDIASGAANSNSVNILYGSGSGTFTNGGSYVVGSTPSSIAAADINGDGITDLATANSTSNNVSILLGRSNNTFTSTGNFNADGNAYSVVLSDINNDGKIDAVTSNIGGSNSISILMGNGDGTFGSARTLAVGNTPYRLTIGDINRDGNDDIVTANNGSNSISVLMGRGDGTFSTQVTYSAGISPIKPVITDLNGDGNLDLVSSNIGIGVSVTMLLGRGDGTFNTASSFSTGASPFSMDTADLNGDGVEDIIVASSATNSALVYMGNRVDGIASLQEFSFQDTFHSKQAMSYFSNVLNQLNSQQSVIGAAQSRLTIAARNLNTTSLEYLTASSRITDIDVAEETSKLVANRITQQIASALLGQANISHLIALKLLGIDQK